MPGGPQTYSSLPIGLFTETLQEVFTNTTKTVPDLIATVYGTPKKTDRIVNYYQSMAPVSDFDQWDMEEDISVDAIDSRYQITITQVAYRKAVSYTWKVKQYIQYREYMADLSSGLARAAATTRQRGAFSFINKQLAGTGDYWCTAEGKYLFATDHPLATGASTWYSPVTNASSTVGVNLISAAVSTTSLSRGFALMRLCPDDMGNPMMNETALALVYPGDTSALVRTILSSQQLAGSMKNDKNVIGDMYGRIRVVECPWLTDTDAVILIGDNHKLCAETSVGLEQSQWFVETSKATAHDATFADGYGAKDWRGVVAIKP
jgi:hypothetical protein